MNDVVADKRIPVGISACLLGQKVRFDGGHKRSRYCLDILSECFEFQSFCPEMAIGLGTPRQPIRLVDLPEGRRAVGTKNRDLDVTEALQDYAEQVHKEATDLCGYILMKGSPSCGMERVKVYHPNGNPNVAGAGLFAERLMQLHPALPVEEEGRLKDHVLRENFITRVFVYHDWQTQVVPQLTLHEIIQFHSRHKYQLMAHHYQGYKNIGRFLAQEAPRLPLEETADRYIHELMGYLKTPATRKTHTNVLMHLLGYLKKHLDGATRHDLLSAIDDYRTNKVHLIVPLALLKHYLKRYGSEYVQQQVYLDPYPHELGLRNYI